MLWSSLHHLSLQLLWHIVELVEQESSKANKDYNYSDKYEQCHVLLLLNNLTILSNNNALLTTWCHSAIVPISAIIVLALLLFFLLFLVLLTSSTVEEREVRVSLWGQDWGDFGTSLAFVIVETERERFGEERLCVLAELTLSLGPVIILDGVDVVHWAGLESEEGFG